MISVPTAYEPRRVIDQTSFDQMVERLWMEFGDGFSRIQVRQAARRCMDDLAGSPPGALPELGERLARQRLLDAEAIRTGAGGRS
ncbi:hypothetical protein HLB23_05405 [Nocardia uniformis]|uniref:Uncharacterized protein n=1 Tax=Nocardia uniformis TaxID=53432 RepID=A0A849BRM4_9NOCA|nr:hypothetical protein [Nocardia uniformis]NNH69312.1 hypothetical protein [Nocardia uniformis]